MEYSKGDRVKHPKKEDWGVGEIIAFRDQTVVQVLFAEAGEKIFDLKRTPLIKVAGEQADCPALDERKSGAIVKYMISTRPKLTADQNRRTWEIIERKLSENGSATFEKLASWARSHDHATGGKGFIEYCIDNGWLAPEGSLSTDTPRDTTLIEPE
jgi:hypothetical protein